MIVVGFIFVLDIWFVGLLHAVTNPGVTRWESDTYT